MLTRTEIKNLLALEGFDVVFDEDTRKYVSARAVCLWDQKPRSRHSNAEMRGFWFDHNDATVESLKEDIRKFSAGTYGFM